MTERWVLNASPIIVLCQVRLEHLFLQLADEVVVPHTVSEEVMAGLPEDPARRFMSGGRLPIVPSPEIPAQIAAWDLGGGETAVLAHCLVHPGWTAILDDRAARRCARTFSIAVKGTLAVILLARRAGLIPSAAETLRQLRANGFRIDDRVVAAALWQTVGETWSK